MIKIELIFSIKLFKIIITKVVYGYSQSNTSFSHYLSQLVHPQI